MLCPPPLSVPDPPAAHSPPPTLACAWCPNHWPPTIRPLSPPCPGSHVPLGGGPLPPSTFNLFRAHGSIHTSTGGGDGCRRLGEEEAGRRRSALPVGRNDGTPGRAPCWIPLAQPNRVAPRRHGDVSVALGTPSIHADLEKRGGTLNWMLCLAEGESVCGKHKRISCLPFRMRRECRIRIGGK